MMLTSKELGSKAAIVGCLLSLYSMGSLSYSSLIIIIFIIILKSKYLGFQNAINFYFKTIGCWDSLRVSLVIFAHMVKIEQFLVVLISPRTISWARDFFITSFGVLMNLKFGVLEDFLQKISKFTYQNAIWHSTTPHSTLWNFRWFLVFWSKSHILYIFRSLSPPKKSKWGPRKKSKIIFPDRISWRFRKKTPLVHQTTIIFDQIPLLKKSPFN